MSSFVNKSRKRRTQPSVALKNETSEPDVHENNSSSEDDELKNLLVHEFNNDEDSSDEEVEEAEPANDSDFEEDELVFETDSENERSDDERSHSVCSADTVPNSDSDIGSDLLGDLDDYDDDDAMKMPPPKELPIRYSALKKPAFKAQSPPKARASTPPLAEAPFEAPEPVEEVNHQLDEYEYDSSDEEDIRNTVGNVPMKWYSEYPHIGYDTDGKKIMKPAEGDKLDNFLKRMEDPDFWRTVKDAQTGQDVILSEADIELITRVQKQQIPDQQFDEFAPWVDWFTSEVMKTPLRKFPEHKRSFLPSRPEALKVSKLVHALKMGWMKSTAEMQRERQEKIKQGPQFYDLWKADEEPEEMRRIHKHIPAPKRHLPGHAESYNPPEEYLFDSRELKQWDKLKQTPWKRKLHFVPQKYNSLREVPAYPKFIKERFQRCLDLFLAPRAIKMKLTIEPEALVPQLPSPKDLQPFPTTLSMVFKGHTDMVRSISVHLRGQYLASGGDDMTLKIWEISTGRCVKSVPCGGVVRSVAWCPNEAVSLIAVAADKKVLLINPGVGDHLVSSKTDKLMEIIPQSDKIVNERVQTAVQWEQAEGENWQKGIRVILNHFQIVKQVTWHAKGDYFAVVMPDGQNRSVLISQLSKRKSQLPFTRPKGLIQSVLFHPIRPFLFVATQRNVRVYDLMKQEMVKKLLSNSQWISTMAIHPGGDNMLVATYDRKILWFDLDLSTKPYQTLRLHGTGVRGVAFHRRYPLFASGADDCGLIVSHGMVYNDLLQNPLIVPLKRLCNHDKFNDFGILDVTFHPIQPWVFSAGADFTVKMYS